MERLKKFFTRKIKSYKVENLQAFPMRKKVENLSEVMDIKFDYSPIPFHYKNVGTYKR